MLPFQLHRSILATIILCLFITAQARSSLKGYGSNITPLAAEQTYGSPSPTEEAEFSDIATMAAADYTPIKKKPPIHNR
ncbi:hypothetical protein CKAN_00605900 [Cinnamomum micranthum f. kanehirae]|uniref:Root meristem growth factor 9 n=1 Tax=Cinnamomum micranthum f. kanehirae TaxID=337451 RepID=A0A443NGB5_9MAGN|nr:hypothetical protein CKAN_00605900 [Cinnamomum micranthum f. kanehirae]